jgi:hypothetical protein
MVTKNWTSKVGLSIFPNNAHEAFLLINGEISQKKFQHSRKNACCHFSAFEFKFWVAKMSGFKKAKPGALFTMLT